MLYLKEAMELQEYFKKHNIDKKKFADEIDVHINTLNNWLSHRTFPGVNHVRIVEIATKRQVQYKDWINYLEAKKKYA